MSTFSARPCKMHSSKRVIVISALLMLALIGGGIIWLYWRCNFYRDPVLQQLRAEGCTIEQHSLTPVLAGVLDAPVFACGEANRITMPIGLLSDRLAPLVGRCRQLHVLDAPNAVLSETGVLSWREIHSDLALVLSNANLEGRCLSALGQIPRLRWLSLSNARLTSENVRDFTALNSVVILDLDGTGVADADMRYVARMPSLESLDLSNTAITTEGLANLKASATLTYIRAANTTLSKDDVNELKRSHPKLWLRLD